MLKDISIIILIVISSYIFTIRQSTKKGIFDPQLMYILLALAMIVMYKMIHYNKLTGGDGVEEGFANDVGSELVRFVNNQAVDNVSDRISTIAEDDRKKYIDAITNLSSQVAVLNQKVQENSNDPSRKMNDGLGRTDTLDLESMQKMQNFQIDFLQKQIEKSKELLQQQEIEENIKKYKPIKVYSSCAVSTADGAFTEDSMQNRKASSGGNLTGDQMQAVSNMLNTISQRDTSSGSVANPQNGENVLGNTLANLLNSQQTSIQLV